MVILSNSFPEEQLTSRIHFEIVYVMNTKLTLRMSDVLVHEAKAQAARRGKSVSQMFSEFVASLDSSRTSDRLPPATRSLLGVMKGHRVSEKDYKKHLREKHS